MVDPDPPKGTIPKGQWNNQERPLTLRKNFKYGPLPQRDDMKYISGQILFVKNVPQYTASSVTSLFTQYKPLEVKNLYPESEMTTFMVALPNADVARIALDVLDGLRIDSTILSVEFYNPKQSTVARREARRKRNIYNNNDSERDGYEADGGAQQYSPATEEGAASSARNASVVVPVRKVTNGVSWANIAQGNADEQPSPSPITPQAPTPPNTVTEPALKHLQQSKPSVEELVSAYSKKTLVDRSSQFPRLTQDNESKSVIPTASTASETEHKNDADTEAANDANRPQLSEPQIPARSWFPPPMRGTFTTPPTASAKLATAEKTPPPLSGIPMSKPYPDGSPRFATERGRHPPPGLAPPPGLFDHPAGSAPAPARPAQGPSASAHDSPMSPPDPAGPSGPAKGQSHVTPPRFPPVFRIGIPMPPPGPPAPTRAPPELEKSSQGLRPPEFRTQLGSPFTTPPPPIESAIPFRESLLPLGTGHAVSTKADLAPPPGFGPLSGLSGLPPGLSTPLLGQNNPPPDLNSPLPARNRPSTGLAGPPPIFNSPLSGPPIAQPGFHGSLPGLSRPPSGFTAPPQVNITPATASVQRRRPLTPPNERFGTGVELFSGPPQRPAWARAQEKSSESSMVEQDSSQVTTNSDVSGQNSSQDQWGVLAAHTDTTEYVRHHHRHCNGQECWFCRRKEESRRRQGEGLVDY